MDKHFSEMIEKIRMTDQHFELSKSESVNVTVRTNSTNSLFVLRRFDNVSFRQAKYHAQDGSVKRHKCKQQSADLPNMEFPFFVVLEITKKIEF